jgi:hypothetical protein
MKLTHLFVPAALLHNGGTALVTTFNTNTPSGAEAFGELEENQGQPYPDGIMELPAFATAKSYSLDWLAGWLQAELARVYDLEADEYEVVTVNDPREGFRLAVVPKSVCYYRVTVNEMAETPENLDEVVGGFVRAETLAEALAVAQNLTKNVGVWYVVIDSIDSFHEGGNEIEYFYDEALQAKYKVTA